MWQSLLNFKMIFFSILIDALPFILISVIVSSFLYNFISETLIQKMLPANKIYSILLACFLGAIFPICDCGMVPIVKKLIQKGVPAYSAIAFMLAAPIMNPLTIFSTFYAFNSWEIALVRVTTALFVAYNAAWIISKSFKQTVLKNALTISQHDSSCCCHMHTVLPTTLIGKVLVFVYDASNEFFEMGRFLVLGSFLSTIAQLCIPHATLLNIGHNPFFSVIVMILFAFLISVCSSADAFIAASFISSFSTEALIAFTVFGPMIDIKNTLMLLHTFRTKFVVFLITIVFILTFLGSYIMTNLF
ncbi:hypothetical protein SAMN05660742_10213 [Propionispira arboris]|uniref:Permease n=1 Tax=Propionispira arboris TaxID=84035 RepID=A0A1H6UX70_9FIRM|nr:hypothetical protein SAMN05660742_10213 [Propionispira arboris]